MLLELGQMKLSFSDITRQDIRSRSTAAGPDPQTARADPRNAEESQKNVDTFQF